MESDHWVEELDFLGMGFILKSASHEGGRTIAAPLSIFRAWVQRGKECRRLTIVPSSSCPYSQGYLYDTIPAIPPTRGIFPVIVDVAT